MSVRQKISSNITHQGVLPVRPASASHQDRSDEVNSTLGVELRFDRVFLWQSMSLGFEVRLNPAFGLRMVCKDAAIRRTTSLTLTKISRVALIVVRLSILYLLTRPQHCSLEVVLVASHNRLSLTHSSSNIAISLHPHRTKTKQHSHMLKRRTEAPPSTT